MTQIFLVSRRNRTLFQKVWAGVTALSMMLSYGGAALVGTFLLAPAVVSAVVVPQVLMSDGFGTGNDLNDIPNWEEEGADSDSSTLAKRPAMSGDDTASPDGGRFAKIGYKENHPNDNPGWICRIIDARGYSASTLSYYWRGDGDAEDNSDKGEVEVRKGDSCTANSGWVIVASHELDDGANGGENWSSLQSVTLPSSEVNDSKFALRFRNDASDDDEYFRIDGVEVMGTPVDTDQDGVPDTTDNCPLVANPSQTDTDGDGKGDACDTEADEKSCTDYMDNDGDQLVDSADPGCSAFYGALTVTKVVVNSDKPVSDFTLKVCPVTLALGPIQRLLGVEVANALIPEPCTYVTSGQTLQLLPGQYQVVEDPVPQNFQLNYSGSCDTQGVLTVSANGVYTCQLTNTYIPPPQCSDGLDNDGDQVIDYPADTGCSSPQDNDEANEVQQPACALETTTTTVVSDGNETVVETSDPAALAWTHPLWTTLPGAKWIWETYQVINPMNETLRTFTEDFVINGFPTTASLKVAADNAYRFWVNGALVCESNEGDNFSVVDTCTVDVSLLHPGTNSLKMEVKNLALANGTPETNPAGALYELSVKHDTCPFATISATKIVCDSEEDLPNWSGSGKTIDANTATDFLKDHPRCRLAEGWQFQSANQTGTDLGNAYLGEAPAPYMTSAPTNASGVTSWVMPLTGVTEIHVREVLKEGYIPFGRNTDTPDVSAELWCANDVLNYDNFDFIRNPENGATYHCVALNAPKPVEPVCETEIVPMTIVSDTTSMVVENASAPAVAAWTGHPSWTASIPGATWIWESMKVADPLVDTTKTFRKTFNVPGTVLAAALSVAGDNSYKFRLNGTEVLADVTEFNYTLTGQDSANPALGLFQNGQNTVEMEVKNWALPGSTDETNPAGALWKLELTYCANPVDVCPNIEGNQSELPKGMMFDEFGACIEIPVCDGETNLLQNGGFEAPAIAGGAWATFVNGTPGLQWVMDYVGAVTDTDPAHKGIEIQNNAAGAPAEGNQLVELDGYHPSKIWQKVTTIPGKEYILSYKYSPRPNTDAAENTMEVSANGSVLTTVGPTASGPATNWTPMSHSFTATTTYTNFLFKDLGPDDQGDGGGLGMYVDDVKLICREATPIDVCPNLPGNQATLPDGYQFSSYGFTEEDEEEYEYETPYCVPIPVDACPNIDGFQEEVPSGLVSQNGQCIQGTFGSGDPYTYGCMDPLATNYNPAATASDGSCQYPVVRTGGEQGGGVGIESLGEVAGAAIVEPEEPAGPACGEHITSYMRMGKKNDPEEVKKLQTFLNTVMDANIPVTGFFGPMTHNWVKKFQKQFYGEIIRPWENAGFSGADLQEGTGFVYKTTKRWINIMKCEQLKDTPIPELTPYHGDEN